MGLLGITLLSLEENIFGNKKEQGLFFAEDWERDEERGKKDAFEISFCVV